LRLVRSDLHWARRLFPFHPPWILSCAPALVGYLRERRPDAMLSALNYSNLTALWARRASGVGPRLVLSERNTLSLRAARGTRRLRSLPDKVRRFYPGADALVAVSDGVAEDLSEVMGIARSRVRTIYNPVFSDEIAARAREPLEHPWFAPGQPPVVLAVGKLRRQKDFPTLLEAFARLRARRPARLVVLCEGPRRSLLEQKVQRLGLAADVALPGFEANPFRFMARSGVFALSSQWEGLPAVLIQAMACGCPVVSTDCPSGPSEILDKGSWGQLVSVGDVEGLARALEETLAAPPPRQRLVERASFFSVDASADSYLDLLLAESRAAPG